jgi:hypothetical protein
LDKIGNVEFVVSVRRSAVSSELQLAPDIVGHGGIYDKAAVRIVLEVKAHASRDFEVQQRLFRPCRLDELASRIEGVIASEALAAI